MENFKINDYLTVPRLPVGGEFSRSLGNYGTPNLAFVDELAETLKGRRVLEIFAGNGRLAGELNARGVEVTATTVFSSHDLHERGLYYPVLERDAVTAVLEFGGGHDVLLVCWPTTTSAVLQALSLWGEDRDVVYLGEVTDYTRHHLASCATDEFFEHIQVVRPFDSHVPRNVLESAFIGRFRRERQLLPGKD